MRPEVEQSWPTSPAWKSAARLFVQCHRGVAAEKTAASPRNSRGDDLSKLRRRRESWRNFERESSRAAASPPAPDLSETQMRAGRAELGALLLGTLGVVCRRPVEVVDARVAGRRPLAPRRERPAAHRARRGPVFSRVGPGSARLARTGAGILGGPGRAREALARADGRARVARGAERAGGRADAAEASDFAWRTFRASH